MKYADSIEDIIKQAASHFEIPYEVITNPEIRTPAVVRARHIAQFLACKLTFKSKKDIATCFNNKDHTGVLYGVSRVSMMISDGIENGVMKSIKAIESALKIDA